MLYTVDRVTLDNLVLSTDTHRHSRLLHQSICILGRMEFSGYLQMSMILCSSMLFFLLYRYASIFTCRKEGSTPSPGHTVTDCSGISVGGIPG